MDNGLNGVSDNAMEAVTVLLPEDVAPLTSVFIHSVLASTGFMTENTSREACGSGHSTQTVL